MAGKDNAYISAGTKNVMHEGVVIPAVMYDQKRVLNASEQRELEGFEKSVQLKP